MLRSGAGWLIAMPRALSERERRNETATSTPAFIDPCLATRAKRVPSKGNWLYEIKFDGYRAQAHVNNNNVTIYSRGGYDWTATFGSVAATLRELHIESTILDGEIVVLDDEGRPDFRLLQQDVAQDRDDRLLYCVFDVLFLAGEDVRNEPLLERKRRLAELLDQITSPRVRYVDHLDANGSTAFAYACKLKLEGILCKRADSPYRSGRVKHWLKLKCTNADHFPIVAFVEKLGARPKRIASLYLGRRQRNQLRYAGKVQTGFTRAQLHEVRERLEPYIRKSSPLTIPVKKPKATWVEPVLQAQVEFTGRTSDGLLREAVFKGLRHDLEASSAQIPTRSHRSNQHRAAAVPSENILQLLPDAVVPTKEQLASYWNVVGKRALKYLARRPLKVVRHVAGSTFYHKGRLPLVPGAVKQLKLQKREGGIGTRLWVDDVAGLLGLVEMDVIEVHPWNATVDDVERADQIAFDLDPGEGIGWDFVLETAFRLKDVLEAEGFESWPKLTGGKGVHIMVPLERSIIHDSAHVLSKRIVGGFSKRDARRYTISASLRERRGRIFLDYLRNGRGTTAVGAFSPRARPKFPIAAPVTWAALGKGLQSNAFTIDSLIDRAGASKGKPIRRDPFG
jgi:bifunctional non-homologous end joining protein LigD